VFERELWVVRRAQRHSGVVRNVISKHRERRIPVSASVEKFKPIAASRQCCDNPRAHRDLFSGEENRLLRSYPTLSHSPGTCADPISVPTKLCCAGFMSNDCPSVARPSSRIAKEGRGRHKNGTGRRGHHVPACGPTYHKNFSASFVWRPIPRVPLIWPNNLVFLKSGCEAVREVGMVQQVEELSRNSQLCILRLCGTS